MPNGTTKKSFSFRIVFQAQDRTLTRGEIDETMERILSHYQI